MPGCLSRDTASTSRRKRAFAREVGERAGEGRRGLHGLPRGIPPSPWCTESQQQRKEQHARKQLTCAAQKQRERAERVEKQALAQLLQDEKLRQQKLQQWLQMQLRAK